MQQMLWALPRFPGASHQVGIPPNLLQVLLQGRTCLFLGGLPSGNWSYPCSGSQTLMWVWNSSPSLQGGSPMGLYREQPLSGAIPHSAPSPASSPHSLSPRALLPCFSETRHQLCKCTVPYKVPSYSTNVVPGAREGEL